MRGRIESYPFSSLACIIWTKFNVGTQVVLGCLLSCRVGDTITDTPGTIVNQIKIYLRIFLHFCTLFSRFDFQPDGMVWVTRLTLIAIKFFENIIRFSWLHLIFLRVRLLGVKNKPRLTRWSTRRSDWIFSATKCVSHLLLISLIVF